MAKRSDRRGSLALTQPPDEPPEVPDRLLPRVQRVHYVARERPFAANEAGIARTVQRKHGHEQVQTQLLVQVFGLKSHKALVQGAHPYAVDADEPRARLIMVTQNPGARGGVAFVREPTFASGLLLAGLVEAIEGQPLDLPSPMVDGTDIGIF